MAIANSVQDGAFPLALALLSLLLFDILLVLAIAIVRVVASQSAGDLTPRTSIKEQLTLLVAGLIVSCHKSLN